ncbi:MAG: polyphosphate kinase 1 [Chloroflexota bacterium]|nr:polyphosphate kinase 1 [Chloroflexota bacterium]
MSNPNTHAVPGRDDDAEDTTDWPRGGADVERDDVSLVPLTPDLYLNRELSWLQFNRRVLEEVSKATTPLLERVKFAAIFAANLDEFFMIRVAGVKRKVVAGIVEVAVDGRTPVQQLNEIQKLTQKLVSEHARQVTTDLIPSLADNDIEIVRYDALDDQEKTALAEVFDREMYPVLTPQAVDRGRRFPHVSNDSLNLIVVLRSGVSARFARVKIPATLPRLIPVPPIEKVKSGTVLATPDAWSETDTVRYTWIEEVIAAHLDRLFPGSEVVASYPFHLLRDSDVEPDEDDDDQANMLEMMRETLAQRPFGTAVRLDIDASMPAAVRDWLLNQIYATTSDLYVIDGPLCIDNLFELVRIDRPDLKDPPLHQSPMFPPGEALPLVEGTDVPDIFALLRERDILLHLPYQSFNTVVDFIRAASTDANVIAIKQTLYRLGKDSPLIPALTAARDDDTQVAVLVELKARFDEENNISWAQTLERAGVHVAYGLAGLKTHCKLTLVVRREEHGLRRYVHVSTGNYNANTARIYEDIGILTSREDIASDVTQLFNVLTGFAPHVEYGSLWVAPTAMRRQFIDAILDETRVHREHGNGYLILKMNSLVDRETIRALYTASQAGVKIDLIIRGICCLRPGVEGSSESIRVISLVGRFLEHSRVYYFHNNGAPRVYIGSADVMERNFDRRVEVVAPVQSPQLVDHLRNVVLDAYLRDTVNARELQSDGSYTSRVPAAGEVPFDAQMFFAGFYRQGSPVGDTDNPIRAGTP